MRIGRVNSGWKGELLSRGLLWSGMASLLGRLPLHDSLIVLNYHRIGRWDEDPFDPLNFSATASEFDQQLTYIERHTSPATLEEALAYIEGEPREKTPRCRVLITFDDGYLDNYVTAFPILQSHGLQAVFFLATSLVGSSRVPWWDRIAFLLKTARRKQFTLTYPVHQAVDLATDGLIRSLRNVLRLYRRSDTSDSSRFFAELQAASEAERLPPKQRRFLSWPEAREMVGGGMAIGSHTHSHCVLTKLTTDQQRKELSLSRALLREHLEIKAETLAYPVGSSDAYSAETQLLTQDVGYRAAFSFHGGTNLRGEVQRFDVKRIGVTGQSQARFRVQTAFGRLTGNYWP